MRSCAAMSWSGIGLGLYICHIIIERHSGQVGKCSMFWFSLPLTEKDAGSAT
jgi:signal transduction histidine kinase